MATRTRKRIYLDYAASTPVEKSVVAAMEPYWSDEFGNAGAAYREGVAAKRSLANARASAAALIAARPDEITFTSGGTEANNLAIFGLVKRLEREGKPLRKLHFITSAIEHPSVLDCFRELEARGAAVTYCGVTKDGLTDPKVVRDELRDNTALISIAYANNEIGTIQPIVEIAKVLRAHRKTRRPPWGDGGSRRIESGFPFFHTDASQAPLYLDCRTAALGVDLMTIDAQKMYGPKGVGFLFARRGTPLAPILIGGSQERGLRPGTPVTPLVVGLAKAFELADARRSAEAPRLAALRDHAWMEIKKRIPSALINGDPRKRLPNNINVSFPDTDNEMLVLRLDAKGIAVGTRSACLAESGDSGSYVISALGKGDKRARSAVRITLGIRTTKADIDYLVKTLTTLLVKI